MSVRTYQVLEAETPEDLADMVSNATANGQIPCGGVCVYPIQKDAGHAYDFIFAQAMCSPAALMPAAVWLAKAMQPKKDPCPRVRSKRG
jgi:hypothetical protein